MSNWYLRFRNNPLDQQQLQVNPRQKLSKPKKRRLLRSKKERSQAGRIGRDVILCLLTKILWIRLRKRQNPMNRTACRELAAVLGIQGVNWQHMLIASLRIIARSMATPRLPTTH